MTNQTWGKRKVSSPNADLTCWRIEGAPASVFIYDEGLADRIIADHAVARVLEDAVKALREIRADSCWRCSEDIPFNEVGLHVCDELTRNGNPCAGHDCTVNSSVGAFFIAHPEVKHD